MPLFGRRWSRRSKGDDQDLKKESGTNSKLQRSLPKARNSHQKRQQVRLRRGGIKSESLKTVWDSKPTLASIEEDECSTSISSSRTSISHCSGPPHRLGVTWHPSVQAELERRRAWLLTNPPRIAPCRIKTRTRKPVVFDLPPGLLESREHVMMMPPFKDTEDPTDNESISSTDQAYSSWYNGDTSISSSSSDEEDNESSDCDSDEEEIYYDGELSDDEDDMYYDL